MSWLCQQSPALKGSCQMPISGLLEAQLEEQVLSPLREALSEIGPLNWAYLFPVLCPGQLQHLFTFLTGQESYFKVCPSLRHSVLRMFSVRLCCGNGKDNVSPWRAIRWEPVESLRPITRQETLHRVQEQHQCLCATVGDHEEEFAEDQD